MKKLYKRILAVVLCLALTAAIVPATVVFADDWVFLPEDQWIKDYEDVSFWPGQLRLYLKGIFIGDITELFPELDIEEYRLSGRYPATDSEMISPRNYGKQHTVYHVQLREKTRESVLEAMRALKDNPLLFAVRPVLGGIIPGEINILLEEQYYTYGGSDGGPYPDLQDILPEIEIESYRDITLSAILASENNGNTAADSILLNRVGTMFVIKLIEKITEAAERAVELLKDNPYVKSADPNTYAYLDEGPDWSMEFTVDDALRILRVAAKLAETTPEMAVAFFDKDGDGEVTVNDALIVLRIAAKLA